MLNIDIKKTEENPLLSILICTIYSRAEKFNNLLLNLLSQADGKPIEILSCCDDMESTVGEKRQELLKAANGKYVCFVDDDDSVTEDYIDTLLYEFKKDVDIVTFKCLKTDNGTNPHELVYHLNIEPFHHKERGGQYWRHPSHLCPIKKEIASTVIFSKENCGEDERWIRKILSNGLIKSFSHIDKVMYFYKFDTNETKTQTHLKNKKIRRQR